jgi:hypothetical protein
VLTGDLTGGLSGRIDAVTNPEGRKLVQCDLRRQILVRIEVSRRAGAGRLSAPKEPKQLDVRQQPENASIAGAVGGNAAGAASKDISLGTLGNTIADTVGGVGDGQLLSALIPMMAGAGNNVDIGALASQAVGGGVAGAIVAGDVGLIENKMAS